MSLYQCEKCGCIENTALGWYHCRKMGIAIQPKEEQGLALCSACGPTNYTDGKTIEKTGKWHGKFRRRFFPLNTLYTDGEGNVRLIKNDEYPKKEDEIDGEPAIINK